MIIVGTDFFKADFISFEEFERILNYDRDMLKEWAQRISQNYWGKDFPILPEFAELDVEKKVYGFFSFDVLNPTSVDRMKLGISNRMVKHNYYNPKMVEQILKHELCHWHVHSQHGFNPNIPHQEQAFTDGHPVFENEIRSIGAISQFDIMSGLVRVIVHRPKQK